MGHSAHGTVGFAGMRFFSVGRPHWANSSMWAVAVAVALVATIVTFRAVPPSQALLDLADGAVWLRSTAQHGITLHDSGDGSPATRLLVAEPGQDFAVAQRRSDAVVINRTAGSVALVDGATWRFTANRSLGVPGEDFDLVTGRSDGWVVRKGSVARVGLKDLAVSEPIPLSITVADAAVSDSGRLVVATDAPDGQLQLFDPERDSSELLDAIVGPADVFTTGDGLAAVGRNDHAVWVDGHGTTCDQLPLPSDTDLVAGGAAGIAVVVSEVGSTYLWEPTDGCPGPDDFWQLPEGRYGPPVLTETWGVIPSYDAGVVYLVNMSDRTIGVDEPVTLTGMSADREFELVSEGSSIWFNDPDSANAGLISPDGRVTVIEKYIEGGGGFVAPEPASDGLTALVSEGGDPEEAPTDEAAGGPTTTLQSEADDAPSPTSTAPPAPNDPAPAPPDQPDEPADPDDPEDSSPPDDPLAPPPPGPNEVDPASPVAPTDPSTEGPPPTIDPGTPTAPPSSVPTEAGEFSVAIAVSQKNPIVGEEVQFQATMSGGSATSYEWTIQPDPGFTNGRQSFSTVFEQAGQVTVTVRACTDDGRCDTQTIALTVHQTEELVPLTAQIQGPTVVNSGDSVTFSDVSEGPTTSRTWTFPGASPGRSDASRPTVVWADPGTYVVELVVTDENGNSDRTSRTVEVVDPSSVPTDLGLACTPRSAAIGEQVTCTVAADIASRADSVAFTAEGGAWTASSGSGQVVYETTADGTVTVIATANFGSEVVTDRTTFEVTDAVADLSVRISGSTTVEIGQEVTFSPVVTGTADSYDWSASGPASTSSSSSRTLTTSWSSAGTYTVDLTVDGPGGPANATTTVVVKDAEPDNLETRTGRKVMQPTHESWPRRTILQFAGEGAVSAKLVGGETYGGFLESDGTFAHTRQAEGYYEFEFTFDEYNSAGTRVGRTVFTFVAEGIAACAADEATLTVTPLVVSQVTDTSALIDWSTNIPTSMSRIDVVPRGGGQSQSTGSTVEFRRTHQYGPGRHPYTNVPLASGTTFDVTVLLESPCGQSATRSTSFTTTGETTTVEVGPPAAPTGFACERRDVDAAAGTWREQWTWTDNSDNDNTYHYYDANGSELGQDGKDTKAFLTPTTSVGMSRIVNSGPGGETSVSVRCENYGGGPVPTTTTTTEEVTTTIEETTTTAEETTTTAEETTTTTEATTTTTEATTDTSETPPSSDESGDDSFGSGSSGS